MSQSNTSAIRPHPARWFVRPDQTEDGSGLLLIADELWAFGYEVCEDTVTGCWLERISDSRYVTATFEPDLRVSDTDLRAPLARALVELR